MIATIPVLFAASISTYIPGFILFLLLVAFAMTCFGFTGKINWQPPLLVTLLALLLGHWPA